MTIRKSSLEKFKNRKISLNHICFFRGWIQGLSLDVIADRYLETGTDIRVAKTTLLWLREQFSLAALRHGKKSASRLLRLQLKQNITINTNIPNIEDFREEFDPNGDYREEDILSLYKNTYHLEVDKKASQKERLIKKQLELLVWIQNQITTSPVPCDTLNAWFSSVYVDRFNSQNIFTIADLIKFFQINGNKWWKKIPKIGEKGGEKINKWIIENFPEIYNYGKLTRINNTDNQVLIANKNAFPDLFSSEHVHHRFIGSLNRFIGKSQINATNDIDAIKAWLFAKAGSEHTQRAYRKEVERFLLWCICELDKTISDVSVEDCAKYAQWISMLGRSDECNWTFKIDQKDWIGKRNIPRENIDWRPFEGCLSESSVKYSLQTIQSLFQWLTLVQYFSFNPWFAVNKKITKPKTEIPKDVEFTRTFSQAQWDYAINYAMKNANIIDNKNAYYRILFILNIAYTTGMRLSELINVQVGMIYSMPLKNSMGVRWMLKVLGKGQKWRAVPLKNHVLEIFSQYLISRNLSPKFKELPDDTPIISTLENNHALSASSMYKIIKSFFSQVAADMMTNGFSEDAELFRLASVHWIRHACGSHLCNQGIPVNMIQKLFGHSSLTTTSIYTESDEETLWHTLNN